jgi:hypothetical protein
MSEMDRKIVSVLVECDGRKFRVIDNLRELVGAAPNHGACFHVRAEFLSSKQGRRTRLEGKGIRGGCGSQRRFSGACGVEPSRPASRFLLGQFPNAYFVALKRDGSAGIRSRKTGHSAVHTNRGTQV